MMKSITYADVKRATLKKGYTFWEGTHNIFLYGVRSRSLMTDMWNDVLGVLYLDQFGNKVNLVHAGTTKPGLYWLKKKKGNINGTAILKPGQYRGCWQLGLHKGYTALVQNGMPFKVWRDDDEDGQFDYNGKTYEDVTGLNMHTESLERDTDKVGAYSAGCQVRQFDKEHFMVMNLLELSAVKYGAKFSYTLFEDHDLIP